MGDWRTRLPGGLPDLGALRLPEHLRDCEVQRDLEQLRAEREAKWAEQRDRMHGPVMQDWPNRFQDLSDAEHSDPADNDVVVWNNTTKQWNSQQTIAQYEYAFSSYKTVIDWRGTGGNAGWTSSFIYCFGPGSISTSGSTGVAEKVFYFDPADFAAGTRATKLRVRALMGSNSVSPVSSITFGLYPVTLTAGASGVGNTYAVGTVTTGSTVLFGSPGSSNNQQGNSGDFAAPAAGYYVLGVAFGANQAAGSKVDLLTCLQVRQV